LALAAGCLAGGAAAAPAGLQMAGNAYVDPSAQSGPRFIANIEFGPGAVAGPVFAIACYRERCRTASARSLGPATPTEVEVPFAVAGGRALGRSVLVRAAACTGTQGCVARTFRWTVTRPVSPG
jgi:hypothetical protein